MKGLYRAHRTVLCENNSNRFNGSASKIRKTGIEIITRYADLYPEKDLYCASLEVGISNYLVYSFNEAWI